MRAREIMQRGVVTVTPDTTLADAARLFAARGISGAPVVGARRKLLGVVSQTDLLRRDQQQRKGEVPAFYKDGEHIALTTVTEDPGRARVAEVMTPAVLCASEDTPVDELARFMLARRVHRVIITSEGAVRGIVTSMDMLRALAPAAAGRAPRRGRAGRRAGTRARGAGRSRQGRRGAPGRKQRFGQATL